MSRYGLRSEMISGSHSMNKILTMRILVHDEKLTSVNSAKPRQAALGPMARAVLR